jgi:hypothetical protein
MIHKLYWILCNFVLTSEHLFGRLAYEIHCFMPHSHYEPRCYICRTNWSHILEEMRQEMINLENGSVKE